jgi:hypothetical protein
VPPLSGVLGVRAWPKAALMFMSVIARQKNGTLPPPMPSCAPLVARCFASVMDSLWNTVKKNILIRRLWLGRLDDKIKMARISSRHFFNLRNLP